MFEEGECYCISLIIPDNDIPTTHLQPLQPDTATAWAATQWRPRRPPVRRRCCPGWNSGWNSDWNSGSTRARAPRREWQLGGPHDPPLQALRSAPGWCRLPPWPCWSLQRGLIHRGSSSIANQGVDRQGKAARTSRWRGEKLWRYERVSFHPLRPVMYEGERSYTDEYIGVQHI